MTEEERRKHMKKRILVAAVGVPFLLLVFTGPGALALDTAVSASKALVDRDGRAVER